MRRLTLRVIALLITLAGVRLLAAGGPTTGALLRDGTFVLLIGATLFAVNSRDFPRQMATGASYNWPPAARITALTGLLCAVSGGLLFGWDAPGQIVATARLVLWTLGLLLLVVGVVWRGNAVRYAMPGYRWRQREDGAFERVPIDDPHSPESVGGRASVPHSTPIPRPPRHPLWIGLLVGLGALVRLWHLRTLPAGCVAAECDAALALLDGGFIPVHSVLARAPLNGLNPLYLTASLLFGLLDDALLSLRLAAAGLGIVTVVVAYPVVRRVTTPAAALAGLALLALNPLHIVAGRLSHPWLPLVLWLLVALWCMGRGLAAGGRTSWALAGLALGLAGLTAPALVPGIALWALVILVLAWRERSRWIDSWQWTPLLLFTAGVLAPMLPLLVNGLPAGTPSGTLAGNPAATGLMPGMLLSALAVAGAGALVRHGRAVWASAFLSGVLLLSASFWLLGAGADGEAADAMMLMLLLLPFAVVAAGLAVDQLLDALVRSWRVLIPARRLVLGAVTALLLMALLGVRGLPAQLEDRSAQAADPATRAMLAALATAAEGDDLYFLPAAALDSSDARLLARDLIAREQVRPLDDVGQLLTVRDQTVRVLIPATAGRWLELLGLFFPGSVAAPRFTPDGGTLLYTELVLPPTAAPAVTDGLGRAWEGTLAVDVPGLYGFDLADVAPGAQLTLLLDNKLVLDTALGVPAASEVLAQGLYHLDVRATTADGTAPDFSLMWTRPDGVREPLPAAALIGRIVPDLGLLATYFPNADFQPPALEVRKDLLLGQIPATAFPYSVVWTGKLAANRAGDYLLAAAADGALSMLINGRQIGLLDPNAPQNADVGDGPPGYVEGIAYLQPGWHDLVVRFAPRTAASTARLLWQPPGGQPEPLSPVYLRPISGQLTAADEALPPPPQLTDPRLARDDFALTQGVELRRTGTVLLPAALPSLPAAQLWATPPGCGPPGGQMNRPHGVALDGASGRLYVADTGNARIAVFALDGTALPPLAPGTLVEPVDVALFADGTLAVLDAGLQQVVRMSPETGEMTPLGQPDSFYRPRGLAVLSGDVVAVADTGGGRVVLLTADGEQLVDFGALNSGGVGAALANGQPVDVLGTARDLWTVTAEDGLLWELNIPGSVTVINRAVSSDGPHMAVLPDGTFFLSDPMDQSILVHDAGGRPRARLAYSGAFELPTGVAAAELDGDQLLAVVDTAGCSLSLWQLPAQ